MRGAKRLMEVELQAGLDQISGSRVRKVREKVTKAHHMAEELSLLSEMCDAALNEVAAICSRGFRGPKERRPSVLLETIQAAALLKTRATPVLEGAAEDDSDLDMAPHRYYSGAA
ncbi:unnamed protein product [Polarella glacialis]|uniref:Uncharacterized protein n=1 Tax=Polarella glacialis TaxID=89957 RepID=A0A813JWA9_POLGL|nr:unnamed protein product [Polarella glacialis]